MKDFLKTVVDKKSLDLKSSRQVMDQIMEGQFTPEQLGAFLVALRLRGETVDEIVGFAQSIKAHALPVNIRRRDLVDTCGTGGDGAKTFNISTAVAFVVASSGLGVAKHGNRSVSSLCGSADVFEALGFKLDQDPKSVAESVDQRGFGFLFAPFFHPAMKNVADVRRNLGVRTVFNILGPLVNPASVKRQVLGVFSSDLLEKMALVMKKLGSRQVLVVRGEDGLDELTISGKSQLLHLNEGRLRRSVITPEDVGLKRSSVGALKGGTAQENAQIIIKVFSGEKGAKRDVVCLNAGAALWVGGEAKNLKEGVRQAQDLIDGGAVWRKFKALGGRG